MVCKVMLDFDKMNACRYKDKGQDTGEFCGKQEECKNENDGCSGSKQSLKIGKGICKKMDNGEPTFKVRVFGLI